MKKANNAWFTLTLVVVALLGALGSSAEADYQDWRFDDATFEARLHDDWLMHDASNVESDGPLFAARTGVAPERAVTVGDTLHDFDAARTMGTDCVLCSFGHQSKELLLTAGVPVVDAFGEIESFLKMDNGQ